LILFRQALGQELRRIREDQNKTLEGVGVDAMLSKGYISEVERGKKEISSELLYCLCDALDTPLSEVLTSVAFEYEKEKQRVQELTSLSFA
jgi:transcriptional regulator with XRE-family HTH domain